MENGSIIGVTMSILETEDGKAHVLAVMNDITEKKKAERLLRFAHENLERQVNQRTGELVAANQALEREIEERRRLEADLRSSEERFNQLFYATFLQRKET